MKEHTGETRGFGRPANTKAEFKSKITHFIFDLYSTLKWTGPELITYQRKVRLYMPLNFIEYSIARR